MLSIKSSIAIIVAIVAQAFGLIWYVAQLDSTVTNLDSAVEVMQESQATVDVAVLQTTVEGLKEKLDSMEVFDSSDLEEAIEELDERNDVVHQRAILHNQLDCFKHRCTPSLRGFPSMIYVTMVIQ